MTGSNDETTRTRRSGGAGRERRTHAERTADTRARIMKSVVETIAELGFQRTTSAEMAKRAGVTWGAVQHHFGGKEGILLAVLEESFERFAERLSVIDRERGTVAERVSLFVDRSWDHYASDDYRSAFEIMLHFTADEDGDGDGAWRGQMQAAWQQIWSEMFGEVAISPGRMALLQQYTFSVLSGLASLKMLEGHTERPRDAELELLKETLLRAFSDGAA